MMKQGDIIFIDLDPRVGHEQSGFRPAIIVSNNDFNKNVNLVIVCPITTQQRGFPLHIELRDTKTKGFIKCEQIRTVDLKARNAKFAEKVSESFLREVLDIVQILF